MSARKRTGRGKAHRFGGDWTTTKLEVLASYLSSYTTAEDNQAAVTFIKLHRRVRVTGSDGEGPG